MTAIHKTQEVRVYHNRGIAMTLAEIEEFCVKAREAGFTDYAKPSVGGSLVTSMTLTRSEPVE